MQISNNAKYNDETISQTAQDAHTRSTIEYEKYLKDDSVIEIRRLLLTNNEINRDIVNNLLLPDNIRDYYAQQMNAALDLAMGNLTEIENTDELQ